MNSIKKILDLLIQSNINVALSAGALTKITLLRFQSGSDMIPLFVVFSSVLAYNYMRIIELKEERLNWYREWYEKNKLFFWFINIVVAIGLLILLFFIAFKWYALLVMLPFFILTFLYVKPTIFKSNLKALRAIPFFKILNIAFCWAGVTVLFPLIQEFGVADKLVWIEFFERFLFVIALTIPFDIRDVKIDSESMQTIPQIIGVKGAKLLAILFLILILILDYSFFTNWYFQRVKTIVLFLILAVLILKSSPDRSRFFTSFWVESVPIIWLLLILYL